MDQSGFYFKFPHHSEVTFCANTDTSSTKSDVILYLNNSGESYAEYPVVVLFGWAGCKHRHLEKYRAIYDKRYITISYIAPIEDIFYKSACLRTTAVKLLRLMRSLKLQHHSIFIHAFSNGGGRVYRHISDLIHSEPEFSEFKLDGVIFDSCPSSSSIRRAVSVYLLISNKPAFVKYPVAFFLLISLILAALLKMTAPGLSRFFGNDEYWEFMQRDPARCPQLYLYSTRDTLVPYTDIEKQINVRKNLNIRVVTQRWEDSAHVAHLVAHREAYIKTCFDFIELCRTC